MLSIAAPWMLIDIARLWTFMEQIIDLEKSGASQPPQFLRESYRSEHSMRFVN